LVGDDGQKVQQVTSLVDSGVADRIGRRPQASPVS
jgi:hypothetical protein